MRFGKLVTLLYVALPALFIGINIHLSDAGNQAYARWPSLRLTPSSPLTEIHRGLDLAQLKQSINRLPSVTLTRKIGNSLRIACGQELSWSIWGNTAPPTLFHSVELWVSEGIEAPQNRERVNAAAATILKYHALLRDEGWTVVIVPIPTKLSIYSDFCEWPNLEKDPLTRRPIVRDRGDEVYDALLNRLQESNVHTVDLRSVYRQYRATQRQGLLLYPAGETHWSGQGLKLAADATAKLVSELTGIERRTIDPSYLRVEEVADIPAGFDPLPQWPSRLRDIYKYQDHLVNGDVINGFQYAQNPTSLMIVVGTSYSGQFSWHIGQPVGFAWAVGGQLMECEFHNGAEAGHGSFAAFASFYNRRDTLAADFYQRRNLANSPKIVVWEFPIRDLASLANQ